MPTTVAKSIASYEQAEWNPVTVLDDTERGDGGYGHTGTK